MAEILMSWKQGGCHCGAVRFTVESRTRQPYMWCYCSICRKTAGGGGYAITPMPARKDAAGAILYAAEKATWMALEAIQCLGGNGYINDYPTGRLLRDAKLYEIGAGTSEIRRMLIGREIFEETA